MVDGEGEEEDGFVVLMFGIKEKIQKNVFVLFFFSKRIKIIDVRSLGRWV